MAEIVENRLLEQLKRFQAGQDRIERKLDELVSLVGHLEVGLAGLRRDFAHADENSASLGIRPDKVSERLERLERRLELNV